MMNTNLRQYPRVLYLLKKTLAHLSVHVVSRLLRENLKTTQNFKWLKHSTKVCECLSLMPSAINKLHVCLANKKLMLKEMFGKTERKNNCKMPYCVGLIHWCYNLPLANLL